MQSTSHSQGVARARLSSMRDIWELGRELTLLAAADIEITETQREQCRTEDRDLDSTHQAFSGIAVLSKQMPCSQSSLLFLLFYLKRKN